MSSTETIAFFGGLAFGCAGGVLIMLALLWVAIHYKEAEPLDEDETIEIID